MLVTDAGAEGITVLECNNIHILESNTKENKTRQAIGRVIRYKSHEKLPKEERYVNVWRYWSVAPESNENERLVDEILYRKGSMNGQVFYQFQDRVQHQLSQALVSIAQDKL